MEKFAVLALQVLGALHRTGLLLAVERLQQSEALIEGPEEPIKRLLFFDSISEFISSSGGVSLKYEIIYNNLFRASSFLILQICRQLEVIVALNSVIVEFATCLIRCLESFVIYILTVGHISAAIGQELDLLVTRCLQVTHALRVLRTTRATVH